ncbi:MAG: DUF1990 domain-containing protein [Proteobacteria bacterium]|nr:DUF1990 domain-containing protein [Pseudomonadota bacterium]
MRAALTTNFDYEPVGRTRTELPDGWDVDVQRVELGDGMEVWLKAVNALSEWRQFDLSWVYPHDDTVPLRPGATFAFVSRQLGLWSVNVCRLVYVIDEQSGRRARFGFGYGTIGTHLVKGEERFLLERDEGGVVSFEIRKFSRPAHLAVRLAGPLARHYQRRFSADALARVAQEVCS